MATEPELTDTSNWLRSLEAVAGELQQYADGTDDQSAAECARKALGSIEYLNTVEKSLPQMHDTMVALARREIRSDDPSAQALRQLQEALVDVGRAMIHVRRTDDDAHGGANLPPYDQWLPFKDGIGVH